MNSSTSELFELPISEILKIDKKDIAVRIENLYTLMRETASEIEELKTIESMIKIQAKIGDIVEDNKLGEVKITKFIGQWAYGVPRIKSGEFGIKDQILFNVIKVIQNF